MKHLKTYEGLFDFLKKDKAEIFRPMPKSDENIKDFLTGMEDIIFEIKENGYSMPWNVYGKDTLDSYMRIKNGEKLSDILDEGGYICFTIHKYNPKGDNFPIDFHDIDTQLYHLTSYIISEGYKYNIELSRIDKNRKDKKVKNLMVDDLPTEFKKFNYSFISIKIYI